MTKMISFFVIIAINACTLQDRSNHEPNSIEETSSSDNEDIITFHLYYADGEFGCYDFLQYGCELYFFVNDNLSERLVLSDLELYSIQNIISKLDEPVFEAMMVSNRQEYYLIVNNEVVYYSFYPQDSPQYVVTRSLANYLFSLVKYEL